MTSEEPREEKKDSENEDKSNNTHNEETPVLFFCKCESVRLIFTLLSSLRQVSSSSAISSSSSSKVLGNTSDLLKSQNIAQKSISLQSQQISQNTREQIAQVCITKETGITLQVYGIARQSQASVEMPPSLFTEFYVNEEEGDDEEGSFSINLVRLLECLYALDISSADSSSTELCLSYCNEILKCEVWDRTASTTKLVGSAALAGIDTNTPIDESASVLTRAFRSQAILARTILKSEFLRLAVVELEVSGASCCTVCVGPQGVELGVIGTCGESFVQLPYDKSGFVSLEVTNPQNLFCTYPLHLLLQAFRGLEIATETCLSINASHMFAIQHQVIDPSNGNSEPTYVDFIIAAIVDPTEDENSSLQSNDDVSMINSRRSNVVPSQKSTESEVVPRTRTTTEDEVLLINSQRSKESKIDKTRKCTEAESMASSSRMPKPQKQLESPLSSPRHQFPSNPSHISTPSTSSSKRRKRKLTSESQLQEGSEPSLKVLPRKHSLPFLLHSSSEDEESDEESKGKVDDYYCFTPEVEVQEEEESNTKHDKNSDSIPNDTQDIEAALSASRPELMFGDTSLNAVSKNCLVRKDDKVNFY